MRRRVHRGLLSTYRRLPTKGRRWAVRTIAPKYTVGAMCFCTRPDGRLLLVRHSYRRRWGVPGGLLQRREAPEDAVVREVAEEVGVEVHLLGEPAVVVDAEPQRVDIVYRARLAAGEARPCSPEIAEVGWFDPAELPPVQFETRQALMALARASGDSPGSALAAGA